jgi:8-oxo-dGTP pyrophosphatase MutT (NUDIX family)
VTGVFRLWLKVLDAARRMQPQWPRWDRGAGVVAVRFAHGGSRPPRSAERVARHDPRRSRASGVRSRTVGEVPVHPNRPVSPSSVAADGYSQIHADAIRILAGWSPPGARGDAVQRRFLGLLEAQPDAARPDNPGAHLTASTLIVSAGLDQVLLCLHGRMHRWVQVGGHCEDRDATVAQAALREATEESGIVGLRLNPVPIDLDIHEVNCRYGASLHFDVRFAAIAPPGAEAVVSAESRDVRWFAPDALPSPLAHATDRLIAPAISAVRRHSEV